MNAATPPVPTSASDEYAAVLAHVRELYGRPYDITSMESIVAQSRQIIAEFPCVGGTKPEPLHTTSISQVSVNGVPGEWVCAEGASPDVRLLWIHGGGWICGKPAHYRTLTEALSAETKASVLAIDYRKAPENPFPAGLDDCVAAWMWMRDHGPHAPASARTCWLAGDSAGGNLTLSTMLRLRERGLPLPHAAATIGAAADLTGGSPSLQTQAHLDPELKPEAMAFFVAAYLQGLHAPNDPFVSPVHAELHGLPPTLMHVGEWEVLRDDTLRVAAKAKAAGSNFEAKVWPEMIHVFEIFVHMLPEAQRSVREISDFLKRHSS